MDHILDAPETVSYPDSGRDKSPRRELLGRIQRDKGQRSEREIEENLSRALGIDIERKLGAARDGRLRHRHSRLVGRGESHGEALRQRLVESMPGEHGEGPLRRMLTWRPNC